MLMPSGEGRQYLFVLYEVIELAFSFIVFGLAIDFSNSCIFIKEHSIFLGVAIFIYGVLPL